LGIHPFSACFFQQNYVFKARIHKIQDCTVPGADSLFWGEGGRVMSEIKVGEVIKFFAKPSVAAVKVIGGELSVGDSLKFTGHTTDFSLVIESMEVNNQRVQKAVAGDYIGIKVPDRVRPGDEVFRVAAD
jgi:putative protease